MSFDLTERPWVLVQRLDGAVEEVSLREVFARAEELRAIFGEVPTQTFALVRLLLAILHRAIEGPSSVAEWTALWQRPALPTGDTDAYLDRFRERFDLLSETAPFYQVADLHTAKEQEFGLERLIADVPAGAPYFTTRLKSGVERISFAEAARWVVHCQAYDPSGIKSGAVGDDRVKGGKGYPIGTGWAGALGGVLVEGRNLRETLLLNLIPDGCGGLEPSTEDLPVWERPAHGPAQEREGGREPYGPLDLYTWQSRRMRLYHDGAQVTGAMIANGDKITPQNRFRHEPMTAWRRSQAQEKKLGVVPVYMPREHEPERAIWRGLGALLPGSTATQGGAGPAGFWPPGVLSWLAAAQQQGGLPASYRLRTRAIGMKYGSQQAVTDDIVDDAIAISVVLLAETHRELGTVAVDAVGDAEAAANAVGQLAGDLAMAAGGEFSGPRDRAREVAYAQLDRPFRRWLAGLGPDIDAEAARASWQREAHEIASGLGVELIAQAGPAAWRGRTHKEWHISTPEADLRFRHQLRRHLPLAHTIEESEVLV